jgi:hypothetical protein
MRSTLTRSGAALVLACVLGARSVSGQGPEPLRKTDIVRLLSNALIPAEEVAQVVRRNCLAFKPTERDWSDLRAMGLAAEVEASIARCAAQASPSSAKPSGQRPSPEAAVTSRASVDALSRPAAVVAGGGLVASSTASQVQIVLRQARMSVAAGGSLRIPVIAARGGIPQSGIQLALVGAGSGDGGIIGEPIATTDDSGFATFVVRAGRGLGAFRQEVVLRGGETLPGRPAVEVVVRPGPPVSVAVEPRKILFENELQQRAVVVATVRDSVGHGVPGERLVLAGTRDAVRFADTGLADSVGRVTFTIPRTAIQRACTLQVRTRDGGWAILEVALTPLLSDSLTGFVALDRPRGAATMNLNQLLTFRARTRLGAPAAGRAVAFRGVNAEVSPATTVTDSLGEAHIGVRLGDRAGSAVVFATMDSVEKYITLGVEPGAPVELLLEYNGTRVDGGRISVKLDTTFALKLSARDAAGNVVNPASLITRLRERIAAFNSTIRMVRLTAVEEDSSGIKLTFRAIAPGSTELRITAGMAAVVRVDVRY